MGERVLGCTWHMWVSQPTPAPHPLTPNPWNFQQFLETHEITVWPEHFFLKESI